MHFILLFDVAVKVAYTRRKLTTFRLFEHLPNKRIMYNGVLNFDCLMGGTRKIMSLYSFNP